MNASRVNVAALAKRFGCALEHYSEESKTIAYTKPPEARQLSFEKNFAIRVIKRRGLGFASFERSSDAPKALRRALALSRLSESSDYAFSSECGSSKDWFHPIDEDELVEAYGALEPRRTKLVGRAIAHSVYKNCLETSEGARIEQRATRYAAYLRVALNGYEVEVSESGAALDWDCNDLVERVEGYAALSRRRKKLKGVVDAVLDLRALKEFLRPFVAYNWSGCSLHHGVTRLREGEAIASALNFFDNPRIPKATGSAAWDDEGFKTRRKPLLVGCVVKNFLWDMATAAKAKRGERGNGWRPSNELPPSIGLSNLEIGAGDVSNLVDECSKGIYVLEFLAAHEVNVVTGDWSLPISTAFVIEGGELVAALKGATLVGNMFEALKEAKAERRRERCGSLLAPRVAISAQIVA